jgi:mannosyltransferase
MTTETLPSTVRVAPSRPPQQARNARGRPWAWIVVPCVLAAALVLYDLATRSLWLDEAASVSISSRHGAALWHAIAHDGGNMIGYYLVLHVLIGAFGDAAAVIRMPSVLATVVSVALVGLIARRMRDDRAALAAGLLSAVSLPLVFWGQDARAYALMITFICGSFLAFIALVDGSRSRLAWAAYVACTVLAAYMSFVALLVVPAQVLAWLWRADRARGMRTVLSAVAAIAACCSPLLVLAERRGSSQLFWVPPPNLKGIGQTARWLTSAGMPPNFHPAAATVPALVVSLVLLIVVAVAVIRARRASWPALLALCWLLIPVALSIGESLAGQPILLYRNSLVALPAVALLLAWGLTHPRLPTWLAFAALAALLALRALQLAPSYGVSPENWKGATNYVQARAQPGDCIAFFPSDGRMPFDYYVPGPVRRSLLPVLPAAPWSATRPFVEQYTVPSAARLRTIESSCPRLWLIASHYGARNGPAASRANYARFHALRATLRARYPRHASATFGWASPVRVEQLSR